MKFKVAENLPEGISDLLRSYGFEADTVEKEGLAGCGDEVLAEAVRSAVACC